ncbi:MAG: TIGR01459 family HAD-type hydrolase [Pseudomonadota bacterium]|nr:TIGR01459 family HAD-type hydrolase [Pseudomonadota bacterium]
MSSIIENFQEISNKYKAIFCDLWGCLHDGTKSFPESLNALLDFRKNGGTVILLTNAPRPRQNVVAFIEHLGITNKYFDNLITSGDAARDALNKGAFGNRIFHIGPEKNLCLFDNASESNLKADTEEIKLVGLDSASCIVCTGLIDDLNEHPSDYNKVLEEGVNANLPMLCANPDIQVDYGERRLWCAGALAAAYAKFGGKTFYFGKPHQPIYDIALKAVKSINPEVKISEILCVGDGLHTDISGGIANNFPTLFVCGGLSREETSVDGFSSTLEGRKLSKFLLAEGVSPTTSMWHFQ